MENDNKTELELDEIEEGAEEKKEVKPKPQLTPEQIEGIERRQLSKLAKKYGVEIEKPKPQAEPEKEKKGFDYGELAYLAAKQIPEEDYEWIHEGVADTRKELKDFLKSDFVQKELKDRSAARAADGAVPDGTNRSPAGVVTENTVEYWVAKDEQPPDSYPLKFRKEVLEKRNEKVGEGDKFAKNSIVAPGF